MIRGLAVMSLDESKYVVPCAAVSNTLYMFRRPDFDDFVLSTVCNGHTLMLCVHSVT